LFAPPSRVRHRCAATEGSFLADSPDSGQGGRSGIEPGSGVTRDLGRAATPVGHRA
jgi:hypothetical protein